MSELAAEAEKCIINDYKLDFIVPTEEEISKMRRVHRELTSEDREALDLIKKLKRLKSKGKLDENYVRELSDIFEEKG